MWAPRSQTEQVFAYNGGMADTGSHQRLTAGRFADLQMKFLAQALQ